MSAPRLEVDLAKIRANARTLVQRLDARGIAVTGVTKSMLGAPELAAAMLDGGVVGLADSRIENIERLRAAGVVAPTTLIRSPMRSQAARVVRHATASVNTELDVIRALSNAAVAQGVTHSVMLMVELGDLREGVMIRDVVALACETTRLPNIELVGVGANLACRYGVVPDDNNMGALSDVAASVERHLGVSVRTVSGGNSANLPWALAAEHTGRINDLRLGESIILGMDPICRVPIVGLHTDAVRLVGEVIESNCKPHRPWGTIGYSAFDDDRGAPVAGHSAQSLIALGHQDVDPDGLTPPGGVRILGASSDHLVIDPGGRPMPVASEIGFGVDYRALLRAMTSPFVEKVYAAA